MGFVEVSKTMIPTGPFAVIAAMSGTAVWWLGEIRVQKEPAVLVHEGYNFDAI